MYATSENIVFTNKNVDRTGRTTNQIFVVGKNGSGFSDVGKKSITLQIEIKSNSHSKYSIMVFPSSSPLNDNMIVVRTNFYFIL